MENGWFPMSSQVLLFSTQERSSWQQRVGELQRLLQQQVTGDPTCQGPMGPGDDPTCQEAALDADAQQAKWKVGIAALPLGPLGFVTRFCLEGIFPCWLPSGKRLHNYGKSPCYQWVNPL